MDHYGKSGTNTTTTLSSPKRSKWVFLMFKLAVMFARVTAEDQPAAIPATGLLCISDCATCPVICSPPPPPSESKSPPSPHHPVHHSPPPESSYYYQSPPPPPPPRSAPPPPPSYISWGSNPPPPPPPGYMNIPSGKAPPNMGQHNYTYPYYYFYASKATAHQLSLLHYPFVFCIVMLSFLVVMLDCRVRR